MLLYSKCRVALAPRAGEARIEMLQSCCDALDTVKKNFSKVEAHSRVMEIWYLQVSIFYLLSIRLWNISITSVFSNYILHV